MIVSQVHDRPLSLPGMGNMRLPILPGNKEQVEKGEGRNVSHRLRWV